jgi:hypothetical protein
MIGFKNWSLIWCSPLLLLRLRRWKMFKIASILHAHQTFYRYRAADGFLYGRLGEAFAEFYLNSLGFNVSRSRPGQPGDFISSFLGVSIEVKTARQRTYDGKYCFQLVSDHENRIAPQNAYKSDFLFLVAVPPHGRADVYFIPVSALDGQRSLTLPRHLDNSKFAAYALRGLVL